MRGEPHGNWRDSEYALGKASRREVNRQKTAHLIIAFTNANTANRAITEGLIICNRKAYIEKVKRDPI
jgi:hypothetical protein